MANLYPINGAPVNGQPGFAIENTDNYICVPAENRVTSICAEPRVSYLAGEDRVMTVPTEYRDMVVESRKKTCP
jgi:hypothetical protein